MARQIAPGTPPAIKAQQYNVPDVDFSAIDKLGDAKIVAANNNFKLYAEALIDGESKKIYEQYKTDPINLANAIGKLPDMLTDLPPEIQDQMKKKIYLNGVSLYYKAQNNQRALQDDQNKKYSDSSITLSKDGMLETYQNILQNHISKAEDKDLVMNDVFLQQLDNLQQLSDLKDSNGKDVYSETQKKKIRDISDVQLEAFKRFSDRMILNDNDNLSQSKDYYTKFILAPERFMSENYMDRPTYEKARGYFEKQLKQAGADIKKARFNQSVKEATELQISDLPGRLESLKESDLIDKKIIDSIEKTNVKFNNIDPSKTESPIAMINLLEIMKEQQYNPAPRTDAEQQKILEQGTATLDSIAEYAQTYGLTPKDVQLARETVVNLETNAAFRPIMNNFSDIIDNFDTKLGTVRDISTGKGGLRTAWKNLTGLDGMSNQEAEKLIKLNNLLAVGTDTANQQIRNGDLTGARQTQKQVQVGAARIKYDWVDWDEYDRNPDALFERNGRTVRVKSFTPDGDVVFEIVK